MTGASSLTDVNETGPTVITAVFVVPFAVAVIVTGVAVAVMYVRRENATAVFPARTVTGEANT